MQLETGPVVNVRRFNIPRLDKATVPRTGALSLKSPRQLVNCVDRLESKMELRQTKMEKTVMRCTKFIQKHPEQVPELLQLEEGYRKDCEDLVESLKAQHSLMATILRLLTLPLYIPS